MCNVAVFPDFVNYAFIVRHIDGWISGSQDGSQDGWLDGWMDGWLVGKQIDNMTPQLAQKTQTAAGLFLKLHEKQ